MAPGTICVRNSPRPVRNRPQLSDLRRQKFRVQPSERFNRSSCDRVRVASYFAKSGRKPARSSCGSQDATRARSPPARRVVAGFPNEMEPSESLTVLARSPIPPKPSPKHGWEEGNHPSGQRLIFNHFQPKPGQPAPPNFHRP